jgi:5-(carboxyamino)imidazole ribonucleotide synthase
MLALSARQMGYKVHVFSPDTPSPAGQIADHEFVADYLDLDQIRAFARTVDVITYEFENVPLATALAAAELVDVRPGPQVLAVAQNRIREKLFMRDNGLPVAPFAPVQNLGELQQALQTIGTPAVLKTAESGYDGKGQFKLTQASQAEEAWQAIGQKPAILESFVQFEREVSVVAARAVDGSFAHYGVIENKHARHILDLSLSPARVGPAVLEKAVQYAEVVLQKLDVVGVLCVEFFLQADGSLLLNEIAPRPHNSGHLTIESHTTSQFEQQLRAVCGLPLGSTTQRRPAAMANLLGDLWPEVGEPRWEAVLALPEVHLHLYGKETARPGRKMGHLTALGHSVEEAIKLVLRARDAL